MSLAMSKAAQRAVGIVRSPYMSVFHGRMHSHIHFFFNDRQKWSTGISPTHVERLENNAGSVANSQLEFLRCHGNFEGGTTCHQISFPLRQ